MFESISLEEAIIIITGLFFAFNLLYALVRYALAEILLPVIELLTPAMLTITDHGILVMVVDMSDQMATNQNGQIVYDPSQATREHVRRRKEQSTIESGFM